MAGVTALTTRFAAFATGPDFEVILFAVRLTEENRLPVPLVRLVAPSPTFAPANPPTTAPTAAPTGPKSDPAAAPAAAPPAAPIVDARPLAAELGRLLLFVLDLDVAIPISS